MRKRAIYSKKRNELHQKYLAMMLVLITGETEVMSSPKS
jgi:hypothetical protein